MIRNSLWKGPLPPKISQNATIVKSSPRVRSTPQRARNDASSGNKPSREDVGLLEIIGMIGFLVMAFVAISVVEVMFSIMFEKLGLIAHPREQKLVARDAVDLMGKENAEWLDWYAREGAGERREREECRR